MRIAVLPSLLAPVREGACFGGAEMAALALAEGLAQRGHDVTLFGLAGSGGLGFSTEIVPSGTPILRPGHEASLALGATNTLEDPFPPLFDALSARAARGALDVLHLHLIDPGALLFADRLARSAPRLVVVATLHLAAVFPATTRVVRQLLAERSPIVFTTPSRFAARSYEGDSTRIAVVAHGVDVADIPARLDLGGSEGLAWAGRRSREKGLVEAIAIARKSQHSLRIAGAPAPEEASSGALPDGVEDLGLLSRREVVERVLSVSLATLVTSSIPESQSLVAVESLACGTPVVAFAVGALPDVVEHGVTGFVVPPGDVDAAAQAVRAIAEGALSRARCREVALGRFDHARTLDAFESIYALAGGASVP